MAEVLSKIYHAQYDTNFLVLLDHDELGLIVCCGQQSQLLYVNISIMLNRRVNGGVHVNESAAGGRGWIAIVDG